MLPLRRVLPRVLVTGLLGWALLAVSCSGGDAATSDPESEAIDAAEFAAAAEDVAADSILALEDYPEGWTQEPPDNDDFELGLSADCAVIDEDALPGEVTHSDSDTFIGLDGQQVQTGASIFMNAAESAEVLDDYVATFTDCATEVSAAYDQAFRDEYTADGEDPNALTALQVTINPRVSPVTADSSAAFRLEMNVTENEQSYEFTYDIIYMRKGRVIGYLTYFQLGDPSPVEVAMLSQTLVSKLAAGDNELP